MLFLYLFYFKATSALKLFYNIYSVIYFKTGFWSNII